MKAEQLILHILENANSLAIQNVDAIYYKRNHSRSVSDSSEELARKLRRGKVLENCGCSPEHLYFFQEILLGTNVLTPHLRRKLRPSFAVNNGEMLLIT